MRLAETRETAAKPSGEQGVASRQQGLHPGVVSAIIAVAVIIVAYIAWRAFAPPPHAPVANPPSAGVPLDPRANPARGPRALRYAQPR